MACINPSKPGCHPLYQSIVAIPVYGTDYRDDFIDFPTLTLSPPIERKIIPTLKLGPLATPSSYTLHLKPLTPLKQTKPPRYSLRFINGLERVIEFWKRVYAGSKHAAFFARTYSKRDIRTLDLTSLVEAAIERGEELKDIGKLKKSKFAAMIEALNRVAGCRQEKICTSKKIGKKTRKICHREWVCNDKGSDRYTYTTGIGPRIRAGAQKYLSRQLFLEAIFARRGLSPYLAAIGLMESAMQDGAVSGKKAVGPYQFIKATAIRFGLRIDRKLGIDERRNVIFAAMAAASLLRHAQEAIMDPSFVEGVSFNRWLAGIMATSAFHAGLGNLQGVLRAAKKEHPAMNGEKLFAYVVSTNFSYGGYRDNSKDYTCQLFPAVDAIQSLPRSKRMEAEDLVIVEITLQKSVTLKMLEDMVATPNFIELNPQFDWKRPEKRIFRKDTALRFIVPSGKEYGIKDGMIGDISTRFIIDENSVSDIEQILRADPYVRFR